MGAEIEMNRRVKRMLLLALLALALGLSGCYVPADQINNGQDGINPGGDNVPFVTVVVTSSPTPVVTPTPTPQPGAATTAPSSGWSGWSTAATTAAESTWTPATTRPLTTITIITLAPTTTRPPVTPTPAPTALKVGAKGDDVRRMQQRLKELGEDGR